MCYVWLHSSYGTYQNECLAQAPALFCTMSYHAFWSDSLKLELPPRQNVGLDNVDLKRVFLSIFNAKWKIVVSCWRQPYFGILYYHALQDDSLKTELSPIRNIQNECLAQAPALFCIILYHASWNYSLKMELPTRQNTSLDNIDLKHAFRSTVHAKWKS